VRRLLIFILFSEVCIHIITLANERKFTYAYESSVLPAGARELEVWNTYRYGRQSFFRELDQRLEFEVGVTDKLMSAFYLNYESTLSDSNGTAPGGNFLFEHAVSISSEWKYKFLDRVADPVGLSLYGEYTLGLDVSELEGKVILDKQIGKVLAAANIVLSNEWKTNLENGSSQTESELELEFSGGISYSVSNTFSMGIEAFIQNLYEDGNLNHSAIFAGPVISFAQENWWATFTCMSQIRSFAGTTESSLDLDEFERMQFRLLFSFHL
jgi:hypothetical protein